MLKHRIFCMEFQDSWLSFGFWDKVWIRIRVKVRVRVRFRTKIRVKIRVKLQKTKLW